MIKASIIKESIIEEFVIEVSIRGVRNRGVHIIQVFECICLRYIRTYNLMCFMNIYTYKTQKYKVR